ncbi:MAG TPA: alpha/beta hydrolase, partial [Burkholderiales bacterium]
MPTEAIRFPGRGGRVLAARLDTPAEAPRAYALFAHCFTCSKDSKAAAYVAQALAAHGIATLRFDFSSLEFSSNLEDLL